MPWIVASLLFWSGWLIYRSSFLVDDVRYFALFDDAMISMVYARNLVEGFGLNWARWGAPVEGFSCPLWTLSMVPTNALLPPRLSSLGVQCTSLALLTANLFAVRKLVLDHFTTPDARHALPAVALTAAYYPLNHWSLMGMETALQTLLICLAVKLTLDIAHRGSQRFALLGVVLGAALLLRLDMALLVGACLAYLIPSAGREPLRRWFPALLIPAAALLGYQAFRLAYFGDWLPNTYYLKMTGTPVHVRIAHGVAMFLDFARPVLIWLVAVTGAALWLRRERPAFGLPLIVLAAYFAYAIYIGGDVYEFFGAANRFVAPVMPLVFVLVGGILNQALQRHSGAARLDLRSRRYLLVGVTLLVGLQFNGLLELQVRKQWLAYLGIQRPLFVDKHPLLVTRSLRLQELLEPEALVATSWAGLPPYFAHFRWVDWLGYNDRTIARKPANNRLTLDDQQRFDPGHMKWDTAYIVDEVRPDAIYLNGSMKGPLSRQAQDYELVEEVFWIRRDTPHRINPTASPVSESNNTLEPR